MALSAHNRGYIVPSEKYVVVKKIETNEIQ